MPAIKATLREIMGLFVGDWAQALGILGILVIGYVAVRSTHVPLLGFILALVLAGHLVWTTVAESRGQRAP